MGNHGATAEEIGLALGLEATASKRVRELSGKRLRDSGHRREQGVVYVYNHSESK